MAKRTMYSSPDCEMIELQTGSAVLQDSGVTPSAYTTIEDWCEDEALQF
jgi:hypothetical protein